VRRLKHAAPERRLVVEVNSVDEALALARAGFDTIQLEKLSPDQVRSLNAALGPLRRHLVLAVAGGINAGNVVAYARSGVDVVVTSAPYMAKPREVQLRITPS
jgi:molybdenum transport protein